MNSSLLNLALIKILPTYFQTMKLKKNTARCCLQIDSSLLLSSIFYKHSYHSPYDPDISCLKKKSLLSPFAFYCLVRKHVSPYNFEKPGFAWFKMQVHWLYKRPHYCRFLNEFYDTNYRIKHFPTTFLKKKKQFQNYLNRERNFFYTFF